MRTTARPSDTGVKGQEDESGRFELPSNPATEWSLYSAASAPGAWQWLLLGAYLFETGPQKMEFVQRGHATMIDRFVLTSDADFRPPGFMREKEVFRLSHNPPSWRTAANAEEVFAVGNQEWTAFVMDVTLDVPKWDPANPDCLVGVGFCVKSNRDAYRLDLSRGQDGGLAASLLRCESDTSHVLAKAEGLDGSGYPHALRIVRAGERILVTLEGATLFDVNDGTFASGQIEIIAHHVRNCHFQDLEVANITHYEEVFVAGRSLNWRALEGEWRILEGESAGELGVAYVGFNETMGLSVSPWSLEGLYEFATTLQLMDCGWAGIAFDIKDKENFSALVLRANDRKAPQEAMGAGILRIENGETRWLWSRSLGGRPGQWYRLKLVKCADVVSAWADSECLGRFRYAGRADAASTGLVVRGVAAFADPTITDVVPDVDNHFGFEPETDSRALSRWHQCKGVFAPAGHPAQLICKAEPGQTDMLLRLRKTLPGNLEVTVDLSREAEGLPLWEPLGNDPVGVPLPTLPNDARIGIALRFMNPDQRGHEYRISFDERSLQDLRVSRDGEEIARVDFKGAVNGLARKFYVRVEDDKLTAAVANGPEKRIVLAPGDVGGDATCSVSIYGENMLPGQRFAITSIAVWEILPVLDAKSNLQPNEGF